jgi:uncharacterized membrane protein
VRWCFCLYWMSWFIVIVIVIAGACAGYELYLPMFYFCFCFIGYDMNFTSLLIAFLLFITFDPSQHISFSFVSCPYVRMSTN